MPKELTPEAMIIVAAALAVLVAIVALRAIRQRDEAEESLAGSWAKDQRFVDQDSGDARYFKKNKLLTPNELQAFQYLRRKLPATFIICPQVRIADIVGVRWRRGQKAAFGRITQKHIDFLIVDQASALLFAVEVDDTSHQRADRRQRDEFVNALFKSVGLPLIRVEPRRFEQSVDLNQAIARYSV
jgi:hypothetical protein